ncbi:hypothetical protein CIB84_004294 [Bambusicola thoracicus]|uniref:Uncharacterized protein n=1 Tax=Bambusicola thoracicus TaxID=9083 RepID=A0A2P4T6F9_BAMTH|nr:hypothetical protein CIB84_004294 [Bambusicola thoracicus]
MLHLCQRIWITDYFYT